MNRHNARQIAVRILFSSEATGEYWEQFFEDFFKDEHYSTLSEEDEVFQEFPDEKQLEYIKSIVKTVHDNLAEIDSEIENASKGWSLSRISRTALSVIRCAAAEMLYMDDIPTSVSINEAVEIAKAFDAPETVSFINGLLGSVSNKNNSQK